MSTFDDAEKAIATHLTQTLTKRQRKAISVCNADLYFGPYYSKSGRSRWEIWAPVLDDIVNDLPRELWYDEQFGEVLEREPEGMEIDCMECMGDNVLPQEDEPCPTCRSTGVEWQEPFWADFYRFDTRAIKRAVFGTELASYV
ncbi:MAG: hypothetical protein MN733_17630 [Nitrososphaera sp.]|nr:hypothetical protein [Nitrososphaera sp.]